MAHEHGCTARREAGPSVGEIARAHGERVRAEHALSPEQHRVLRAIERCRTAALGGHLHKCPGCDFEQPRYNSCRNRHCPGCQSLSQLRWLEARRERILDTGYFHVVFTIPEALRGLFGRERQAMYGLLMEAARRSLLTMSADPKRLGALPAITLVLHTWTRELLYHPHVHAVVSAGGYDLAAQRWVPARGKARFLFPVKALAKLMRGMMREAILPALDAGKLVLPPHEVEPVRRALFETRWHVYAKAPFAGAQQVFAYLGRYTHRVGISNARLMSYDGEAVTFATKHGQTCTLHAVDFLARLLRHTLPRGFHKIRHAGLVSTTHVRDGCLARAQATLADDTAVVPDDRASPRTWVELMLALSGHDPARCPRCDTPLLVLPLPVPMPVEGIDSS
ncbi:MAG: transposase [Myxococcales bacterium]|nr:transposase [Myxococcales bacterium]